MNIDQEKMIVEALPSLYPLKNFEEEAIHAVLNAIPHWIPVTKEEMFKAGYDGREIIFKVDGRLFAIRELAQ